ncbi:uncharacterized protein V6R79_021548 [Siganus canaliculatus]
MKSEPKIQLLKFFSVIFNSVFLFLGLSLAGCGIWILFSRTTLLNFLSSGDLHLVGAGLLLIGGVVLLVSVVVCVGAQRETRFLLLLYLGSAVLLLLAQLFVLLLLAVQRDKIGAALLDEVSSIISAYGNRTAEDRVLDDVQTYAACCGLLGPSDWLNNSFVRGLNRSAPDLLPCSCFRRFEAAPDSPWCLDLNASASSSTPLGRGNGSYVEGCQLKLGDWLLENGVTVMAMAGVLVLMQVLQSITVFHLWRTLQRDRKKTSPALAGAGHAPLDHAHLNPAHLDPAHLDPAPEDYVPEDDDDYAQDNYGYDRLSEDYARPAHPPAANVGSTHLTYHHGNKRSRFV